MVVHADHRNIPADRQPLARRTFINGPRPGVVETEEAIRVLAVEQFTDLVQCGPLVQHVDDEPLVVSDPGLLERLPVPFLPQVLGDHRFGASDIGDAPAAGLDQPVRGILGDHDLVRFHAGDTPLRIGGVHQHHGRILHGIRHVRDPVRHLRIHESVHTVALQCGDLVRLIGFAVGAHGQHHVSQTAGRVLRPQDDAAGVRGGGDLLADETQDAGPAGAQAAGQRIRAIPQFLRSLPHARGDLRFDTSLIAVIHHQRHSGNRYSRLLRNLLHRRHASNDTRRFTPCLHRHAFALPK